MIAWICEVAVGCDRFSQGVNVKLGNWRQVTVLKNDLHMSRDDVWDRSGNTRASVQSPLVVLLQKKVRKGGDFFYGKPGNEDHFEGL